MKDFIKQFKELLAKQQKIVDNLSNTQREKEYKLNKLDKQYQSKIDKLLQAEKANELLIRITREFVAKTEYSGEMVKNNGRN